MVMAAASSVAAPAAARAADSLSVRECMARAREHALQVQAAAEGLHASRQDALAARANAHPELHLHSSAWLVPDGSYDPAATNEGQFDLRLVSSMTLYDGGALGRERARAGAAAHRAETDLAAARREAAGRAAELAVGILQTTAGLRRRVASRNWTEGVVHSIEASARAGTRSPSDVARLRLDLQTLSVEIDDLDAGLERQGRELGAILAPDSIDYSFTDVRDSSWAEGPPEPADSAAVLRLFENSSEVTRATTELELARLDLASARGQRASRLGATLDAGLLGTDLTRAVPPDVPPVGAATFSDRLKRDLGASVTIDFLLPLLQPGVTATIGARESAVRAAELRANLAMNSSRRAALDLLSRWRSAARRLALQRDAASMAELHALRVQSLYLSGSGSLLDLIDARKILDEDRDQLEAARGELLLTRLEGEIGS